jgi:hypothetical protein
VPRSFKTSFRAKSRLTMGFNLSIHSCGPIILLMMSLIMIGILEDKT